MRETRLPRRVGLDSHILAVLLDGMDELEEFSEEIRAIKTQELLPSDWRYLSGHFRQSDRRCSIETVNPVEDDCERNRWNNQDRL